MINEPTVSYSARKQSINIVASLVLASIVLAVVVFPKLTFADQSVDSFQVAEAVLPEKTIFTEQKIPQDTLKEEQLIASLMQDVIVPVHGNLEENGHWRIVRMRVTGYCPCSQCCGDFSDGITANNHRIQPGDTFVAADKSYRFGTEMMIPGYNGDQSVQVMDRGGAIKGNRLDLFFHTHQQALQWGVQYLDVLIKTK